VAGAWRVEVNRGTEQAVLLDLEYFVARELERKGGYAGIDPQLSVAIARRTVAAHQARRVIPTRARYRAIPSAPVTFEAAHDTYVSMITRDQFAAAPRRGVTVAILDSAFDHEHLAAGVNVEVTDGFLTPDQMNRPHLAHGAVTASIIGSLAPSARIVVYPVVGGDEVVREDDLALSLQRAVGDTNADVVVMCLQLPEHNGRSLRGLVEYFLDGVGERPAVIASSGNSETAGSLVACYPGTHRAVMMVGGVDSGGARAEFSCYDLRGRPRPALFVVAPSGAGPSAAPREYPIRVGGRPIVGTSVAAAYAAGVVARSLARSDEPPARAADLYRMLANAAVKLAGWDETQRGKGLVRELPVNSRSAVATPDNPLGGRRRLYPSRATP
jgi:hypothetical protein